MVQYLLCCHYDIIQIMTWYSFTKQITCLNQYITIFVLRYDMSIKTLIFFFFFFLIILTDTTSTRFTNQDVESSNSCPPIFLDIYNQGYLGWRSWHLTSLLSSYIMMVVRSDKDFIFMHSSFFEKYSGN